MSGQLESGKAVTLHLPMADWSLTCGMQSLPIYLCSKRRPATPCTQVSVSSSNPLLFCFTPGRSISSLHLAIMALLSKGKHQRLIHWWPHVKKAVLRIHGKRTELKALKCQMLHPMLSRMSRQYPDQPPKMLGVKLVLAPRASS